MTAMRDRFCDVRTGVRDDRVVTEKEQGDEGKTQWEMRCKTYHFVVDEECGWKMKLTWSRVKMCVWLP